MFEEYIKPEIIVTNPKSQDLTISSQYEKQDIPKYWDKDFINQKIASVKDHKKKMYLTFLWRTGVRVTESVSLQKKDIDFQNDTMTVKWLKSRKYLRRVVPLHPHIKDLLQVYTANLKSDDKVFPFSRQRAYQIVKSVMGGSPHQMRHSFAVNWLRCGADIVILSRMLGHSKLNTTMEYLKIVPVDQGKELLKVSFQ